MSIVLSQGQAAAYDDIMRFYQSDEKSFTLAGYAGTGKSTLASMITENIGGDNIAQCAYTGKAANVLREKGAKNASTIHGWLYDIKGTMGDLIKKREEQLAEEAALGNEDAIVELRKEIKELQEISKKPRFQLNKFSPLRDAKLVVVDEYSMLSEQIVNDLLEVAPKVLFLGDPYQLPPVSGKCPLKPDAFLEDIHRQAMDSDIIRYSKEVREGRYIPLGGNGDLKHLRREEITTEQLLQADQIICGRNNTRSALNDFCRAKLGFTGKFPSKGEKLICLRNNTEHALFNGMIGRANSPAKQSGLYYYLDFEHEENLKVFSGDIFGRGDEFDFNNHAHRNLERFDYAYAITCHKSQGSEFDDVIVVNEPIGRGEDRLRWLYTAITRAKKTCTLVRPRGQ